MIFKHCQSRPCNLWNPTNRSNRLEGSREIPNENQFDSLLTSSWQLWSGAENKPHLSTSWFLTPRCYRASQSNSWRVPSSYPQPLSNILSYFGGATVESKGIDSLEPLLDLVSMLGPRGVLPEVPNAYESPNQVGMVRAFCMFTRPGRSCSCWDPLMGFPDREEKLEDSDIFLVFLMITLWR